MSWLSKRLHWIFFLAVASLFYLPLGLPIKARLPNATFGLLTVGFVYLLGRRWMNERTGLFAGCILATSLVFFGITQHDGFDLAITFWLTLALYAGTGMLTERLPERVRRFSTFLAVAMAGAFLMYGYTASFLPCAVIVLAVLLTRSSSQMSKISWQEIFLCFGLFITPWLAYEAIMDKEMLLRRLLTVRTQEAPSYYFLPTLLAAFLPWSVFLPHVTGQLLKHRATELRRDPVKAMLFLWVCVLALICSLARLPLLPGLLPVLPALALLCGETCDKVFEAPRTPEWLQQSLLCLAGLCSGAVMLLKLPQAAHLWQQPIFLPLYHSGSLVSFCLSAIVMICVGVWGMGQPLAALGGIVISQALLFGTLTTLGLLWR